MQPGEGAGRVLFIGSQHGCHLIGGTADRAAESDCTAFYDATWRRTVAVAYAMTGDLPAAEDLAKEADSRAWPRWSTLKSYDDPGAWVRQVTSRLAVSRRRRTKTAVNHLARSRVPAFLREINHAAIDQAFGSWFTGWYADAYYEGGDRCRPEERDLRHSVGRPVGSLPGGVEHAGRR